MIVQPLLCSRFLKQPKTVLGLVSEISSFWGGWCRCMNEFKFGDLRRFIREAGHHGLSCELGSVGRQRCTCDDTMDCSVDVTGVRRP